MLVPASCFEPKPPTALALAILLYLGGIGSASSLAPSRSTNWRFFSGLSLSTTTTRSACVGDSFLHARKLRGNFLLAPTRGSPLVADCTDSAGSNGAREQNATLRETVRAR